MEPVLRDQNATEFKQEISLWLKGVIGKVI